MKKFFVKEITEYIIREKPSKQKLSNVKIKLAKKHKAGKIPTDIEILLNAPADKVSEVKPYLSTKPVRSLSGVSVVAIMTPPHKCPHGKCITCPGGVESVFGDVPQSYTGEEPATRRAKRNHYDPYLQVINRLEQYVAAGHFPQKIELIIMGGTFPSLDEDVQDKYVMYAFKAMNDFSKLFFKNDEIDIKSFKQFFELPGDINDPEREKRLQEKILFLKDSSELEAEQRRNEKSNVKCVGLTIETRSDYARKEHALQMLKLGCTRVELGVQSVYDEALEFMQRGHTAKDNIESIRVLKDLGFKINAHYMPGLMSDRKNDLKGMIQLFDNPDYRPDMLKLYPCMVVRGTKLYDLYRKKKYSPLTTKVAAKLIAEFKKHVPGYCRIMRVQRDIPSNMITAGVDRTNLRQYVMAEMKDKGIKCGCIRCREIASEKVTKSGIKFNIYEYDASQGKEYFISADYKDKLLGYCRLRIPSESIISMIDESSALVRELHVYGPAIQIGKGGKVQHSGIGKKLLSLAEKTAKKNSRKKVIIISGIGVRPYYRKQGYKKQKYYMVKRI